MAPWLRDAEGNDVFDSVNSPLSGEPIFDPISTEQTFGSNPVTRTVDEIDSGLRTISASTPGGITAGSGIDAIRETAEVDSGTTMNWYEALNVAGGRDPDAENPPGAGATKLLFYGIVAAVALYLLGPFVELATEVLDE